VKSDGWNASVPPYKIIVLKATGGFYGNTRLVSRDPIIDGFVLIFVDHHHHIVNHFQFIWFIGAIEQ
jgi:hypothetical protein